MSKFNIELDEHEVIFLTMAIGNFVEAYEPEEQGMDEQELEDFNNVRQLLSKLRKLQYSTAY